MEEAEKNPAVHDQPGTAAQALSVVHLLLIPLLMQAAGQPIGLLLFRIKTDSTPVVALHIHQQLAIDTMSVSSDYHRTCWNWRNTAFVPCVI
jgi:hypothetical protein